MPSADTRPNLPAPPSEHRPDGEDALGAGNGEPCRGTPFPVVAERRFGRRAVLKGAAAAPLLVAVGPVAVAAQGCTSDGAAASASGDAAASATGDAMASTSGGAAASATGGAAASASGDAAASASGDAAASAAGGVAASAAGDAAASASGGAAAVSTTGHSLGFAPIELNLQDAVVVPDGYESQVLMRWGDPLRTGVERMTIDNATRARQEKTFGWNPDLNAYFTVSDDSDSEPAGLMCVNHEYTEGARMFSDYDPENPTRRQVDVEIAAHGMSIVMLRRGDRGWTVDLNSRLNRRITGFTPMEITGPLASHELLETSADPTGRNVEGMLSNCAGGKTPWGTVLTAEENFNQYFANNDKLRNERQRLLNERYGVFGGASRWRWEQHYRRFDVSKAPHEVNRFGYIVEIDPHDPSFVPKKRTALGRFKHEAATVGIADSGQAVVYSGDDERFEYLYKFVTAGIYDEARRQANLTLLDSGVLHVARFHDDGTGEWLPLVGGTGPLARLSQAEVLLNTRGAADLLGATPMDRPEDVEVNPRNNRVYVCLTNNTQREAGDENAVNPRADNAYGHVLEITEDGGDLGASTFTWEFFLLCGDPADDSTWFAGFDKSQVSAIAAPDNLAFDERGNVWIATDGQPGTLGLNDALYAVPSAGARRGNVQPFLSVPRGAEVCGPEFTPDFETLFVNVQHPGEASSDPADPQSLWPDGVWPPLPSLVAVTKTGGGRIGS